MFIIISLKKDELHFEQGYHKPPPPTNNNNNKK